MLTLGQCIFVLLVFTVGFMAGRYLKYQKEK